MAPVLCTASQAQLPAEYDEVFHVLRRITNGPRPSEAIPMVNDLIGGQSNPSLLQEYIEEQIDPATPLEPNPDLDALLLEIRPVDDVWTIEQAVREHLAEGLYSERQLQHIMGYFWRRHFNTSYNSVRGKLQKFAAVYPDDPPPGLNFDQQAAKVIRDENVAFRENALGNFEQLLIEVSAKRPPMILFLDSAANSFNGPGFKANENYARELLELHTVGLNADGVPEFYDEQDIRVVAEAFTGWNLTTDPELVWKFLFRPGLHRDAPITPIFIDDRFSFSGSNGEGQGDSLLTFLAVQPETARHICHKLFEFFIAEDAPLDHELINDCVAVWEQDGVKGNIQAVLTVLLNSPEFRDVEANRWNQARTPLETVTSIVRLFDGLAPANQHLDGIVADLEGGLGQKLFRFPAPNGPSPDNLKLISTTQLLSRANFAQRIYNDWFPEVVGAPNYASSIVFDFPSFFQTYGISPVSSQAIVQALMALTAQSHWPANEDIALRNFLERETNGQPENQSLGELVAAQDFEAWTERIAHFVTYMSALPQTTLK